jgi:hypothetical protein
MLVEDLPLTIERGGHLLGYWAESEVGGGFLPRRIFERESYAQMI